MNNIASASPWKYVITWLRLYFGAHLFFSGIRYITSGYVPFIPGPGGAYVAAATVIHMYPAVKYMEFVFGTMLLTNRFVLLALILEMPTTVTIFWLNTFVVATPVQLFSGPQELLMNCALLLAYSGYMASVFRPKLKPMWLWEGWNTYFANEADERGGLQTLPSAQRSKA